MAEASRKLCREDYEEESSPLRGENFVELTILILNLSIDLLRADLMKDGCPNAMATLDFLVNRAICAFMTY